MVYEFYNTTEKISDFIVTKYKKLSQCFNDY